MNILYSQYKTSNETLQSMPTSSKLLLAISTALFVFTSFFLSLFLMAVSLILVPFTVFSLWLFKRKTQKDTDSNTQYSDFANTSEPDNSIIEAEYTVIKSD